MTPRSTGDRAGARSTGNHHPVRIEVSDPATGLHLLPELDACVIGHICSMTPPRPSSARTGSSRRSGSGWRGRSCGTAPCRREARRHLPRHAAIVEAGVDFGATPWRRRSWRRLKQRRRRTSSSEPASGFRASGSVASRTCSW